MMDIDTTVSSFSTLDSLPPGFGDSDPTDLDRLAASLHHLALCCGKSAMKESDQRSSAEAATEDQPFLIEAVPIALVPDVARHSGAFGQGVHAKH